mgnify:CR=1 FL=1
MSRADLVILIASIYIAAWGIVEQKKVFLSAMALLGIVIMILILVMQ